MPVKGIFPTPIYIDYIDNLDSVQQELEVGFNKAKSDNLFGRAKSFESSNHTVSSPEFNTNIIDIYSLDLFKKELYINIDKYLKVIAKDNFNADFKIKSSWFTNTEKHQYARQHNHGISDMSGVYYFKTNGLDGNICFENPCKSVVSTFFFSYDKVNPILSFKPEVGKIILWPSWLDHLTYENTTEDTRISLSFNIIFNRF